MPHKYEQENPMDVYNTRMTAKHARIARTYGGGNLSKGVRYAIEFLHRTREEEKNRYMREILDKK